MHQQRLGRYGALFLLIVLLPTKSEENASELLHHLSNNERYNDTTMHNTNFPRNKTIQTLRLFFRENSTTNNPWEETNSTSTDLPEFDEEEDEFARRNVTKNWEGQAYANETTILFFAIPRRYENGIYFIIEPRDITKENENNYIQFCCFFNHRFSLKEEKCVDDPEFIFPTAMSDKYLSEFPVNLRFLNPSLSLCKDGSRPYMIDPVRFPDTEYIFSDDGRAQFTRYNALFTSSFCLTAMPNQPGFELIMCATIMHTTATVTIVSSIFLLITFVVYSVLREFRKMHDYLLRAYIVSLLVSNAMYAAYLQIPVDTINYSFCASLSFIFLFAMYSAFLWLNVMCFNIWRTFREFSRLHEREVTPDRTSRRFMIYSLYALGVSFVLTSLTIIMDFVPNIPDDLIKPNICKFTVDYPPSFWFGTRKARNFYFYLPIGIISICNTCLFLWIALKILCDKMRMKCSMQDSESRQHDDCNKKRLWMCLKLFILMVISWIPINLAVEVGRWIVDIKSGYVWLVASLITCLQGIIIFIFFVCKKKVITLLLQRFGWSVDSSFRHFRKKSGVYNDAVALGGICDQHNEIRGSTENTGN